MFEKSAKIAKVLLNHDLTTTTHELVSLLHKKNTITYTMDIHTANKCKVKANPVYNK
jgi:hypothetical protein